jgi:HD-GYP domain-containing protein (c-di-GMP phosphodiesterase class II)
VTPQNSKRLSVRRPRILWVVLVALMLVSILPIGWYHRQVLQLSQQKLVESERYQQAEITRSLAAEFQLYEQGLHQQLVGLREVMALAGLSQALDDPKRAPQVTALLENFVSSNPNILYATAIGRTAKGQSAGGFRAEGDPFINKALQRAFTTAQQRSDFQSEPLATGQDHRPAFVISVPMFSGDQFDGMLAAVVSLERPVQRLNEASVRGREVYVVDRSGRLVAHSDSRRYVPGQDLSPVIGVVARVKDLPPERHQTETSPFTIERDKRPVEMIGTYSTVPQMNWAVIAQRSLDDARKDAGMDDLNRQAVTLVAAVALVVLVVGYFFAVGITKPIRGLADATRAISDGEFKQRAPVHGAAEISELAETFNKMAGDIEKYIVDLKEAAEENKELFLGSIRMLAAAIDEKDPYTRGHSGRVAKYSTIIGENLGLSSQELERLKISALLHDVGKIGIDDRVLKKPGSLTPEEFEVMKQHPVKGANIMRPVAQLKEMLPGIELHHEHVDGKGYPYGLRGEQIPLMARIIAAADTLDAMTTNRPYQSAMDVAYALEKIRACSGTKFDPAVVEALEAAVANGKLRLSATLVEV